MTAATSFDLPGAGEHTFTSQLVDSGLLRPTREPGIWQRSAEFERIVTALERSIERLTAEDGATVMRFSPVFARENLVKSGFLESFPHLSASLHCFAGHAAGHLELMQRIHDGRDWSDLVEASGLALVPAACHPVYPAASGRLEPGGKLIDVSSWCFRHEPSDDPVRMQAFRMHEQVRLGSPDDVVQFRDRWLERAEQWFQSLAVPARPALANDPFFGRAGKLLAVEQREQALKFELVVPITSSEQPTAIMSFNYHREHFGRAFAIETAQGELAHSACVGFGLERIALALLKTHGLVPADWPSAVRAILEA